MQAYGLKRLARGLASSRQGARQGFAAALAATLAHSAAAAASQQGQQRPKQQQLALEQPFMSAAGVLALLDACLEVTGSMKGAVSGCWQHQQLLTEHVLVWTSFTSLTARYHGMLQTANNNSCNTTMA